ncbi:MAG: precorrin-2 C(20)-methyltransferase [Arachnia sp.]
MRPASSADRHRLIGIGVGPGDPQLVTLQAVQALNDADVVLVPATETSGDEPGRAEQIVAAVCPGAAERIQRVPFSMAARHGIDDRRRQAWLASAVAAESAFETGASAVGFATVGDPSVYSTFSYLAAHVREAVPGLEVAVIPGITAMQALAATSLTPLVEGQETLSLVPVTAGLDRLTAALETADTVVAYKGGGKLPAIVELARSQGRHGVVGVNVGLDSQQITSLAETEPGRAPYFSTVLLPPVRTETGGRL